MVQNGNSGCYDRGKNGERNSKNCSVKGAHGECYSPQVRLSKTIYLGIWIPDFSFWFTSCLRISFSMSDVNRWISLLKDDEGKGRVCDFFYQNADFYAKNDNKKNIITGTWEKYTSWPT